MKKFTSHLCRKDYLTPDIVLIEFEVNDFIFKPGQFIQVIYNPEDEDNGFRDYSILNAEYNKIQSCVKLANGYGSNILKESTIGQEFLLKGPLGTFIFHEPHHDTSVFIAGGTGITPIYCMLKHHLTEYPEHKFILLYTAKNFQELVFHKEFLELKKNKNFLYYPTLTRDKWDGLHGRIQDHILKILSDYNNKTFYICGLSELVKDIVIMLRNNGISNNDIHFERYD